jgi:hypothetical protein
MKSAPPWVHVNKTDQTLKRATFQGLEIVGQFTQGVTRRFALPWAVFFRSVGASLRSFAFFGG